MFKLFLIFLTVFAAVNAQCPKYAVQIFTSTSRNAKGLNRIVTRFQRNLGGVNNGNSPGPLPDGQRSVRLHDDSNSSLPVWSAVLAFR